MPSDASLHISKHDGVTVVALSREYENLDEDNLSELTDTLLAVAQNAEPPLVVLDLSSTTFFGTSFLGTLIRVCNRLRAREGGRLAVCELTPHCAKVLRVTHLDGLWDVFGSQEEALSALSVDA